MRRWTRASSVTTRAAGVRTPRAASGYQPRFLTPAEVERLAAQVRSPYDLLVRFTAYTGLRWGEVAALRAGDVDLLRRRVTVARSLERGGTTKDTKTHSRRVVHLEPALADDIRGSRAVARAGEGRPAVECAGGRTAELHELPPAGLAPRCRRIGPRSGAEVSRPEAHVRVVADRPRRHREGRDGLDGPLDDQGDVRPLRPSLPARARGPGREPVGPPPIARAVGDQPSHRWGSHLNRQEFLTQRREARIIGCCDHTRHRRTAGGAESAAGARARAGRCSTALDRPRALARPLLERDRCSTWREQAGGVATIQRRDNSDP
ncbi:MAG: tyrosine-type recombinase/integrase [Nitriliruptorales bacterium]|nr:tyrosine-type recombinase/integrase [Nitriliruptorales bacterium]